MIKFEPFPIIINGNTEDDELYEAWKNNGAKPADKPRNLDDLELRPSHSAKAAQYEQEVYSLLSRIGRSTTGRLVLAAASFHIFNDIYIVPLGERDRAISGKIWSDSCPAPGIYTRTADQYLKNTRIVFTPYQASSCSTDEAPDVTLVHELVHAVRPQQAAKLMQKATHDVWKDLEEFFAVAVANMYRSERGDKTLRGAYTLNGVQLYVNRSTSRYFLEDEVIHQRIEDALKREDLARMLSHYPQIPFNPFAEALQARKDLRSI